MEDWRTQLKLLAPALAGVAIAVGLLVGLRLAGVNPRNSGSSNQTPKVGDLVPEFQALDLSGKPVSSRELRGTAVFLNFWATWCPPCIEEMPSIQKLHDRTQGLGLRVVAVNVDTAPPEAIQGFLSKSKLTLPVWLDPSGTVARRLGTFKYPETYLLDRNGKIQAKFVGAHEWTEPPFDRLLGTLVDLGKPKPDA